MGDELGRMAVTAGHADARSASQLVIIVVRSQTGEALTPEALAEPEDTELAAARAAVAGVWFAGAGDLVEARRRLAMFPPTDRVPPFIILNALAVKIEIGAALGERDLLADCYRRLAPYADLFVCGGAGTLAVSGCAHMWLGVAAAALRRWDDAERHLRAGVSANQRAGTPPFTARAQCDLARVLLARNRRGDADEAVALLALATATADRLGMQPLLRRCRELAEGAGGGSLTRREREIAELVAQRLTNRQIAAAVYTSERTVETHVRNCLAKLGLGSRAELADWVRNLRTGST